VWKERAAELRREYPDAITISALAGCEALLEEIYRTIASGRERMEVFIPHAEYAAASRLYGLAEIHAQENTPSGLWMDVSLPRSASAKYAPYKV
jgi:GTPase